MNTRYTRLLAVLLALLFLLSGCGTHGKTLIEAEGTEISVNVFQLYLSRMKGSLASAGYNVNSDDFWNSYISTDHETMADHYTTQVFEGLRQIAAAMILYDELGLKLPKNVEQSIDDWIDALIEEVGGGSKSQLNSLLASYGANVTTLRDASIIEAKLSQLKEHLYGAGGSLIAASAKEEFYQATYIRGYQMQLANYYYKRDVDEDGRTVYYTDDTYKHIAYDTDGKDVIKTEELDKNGDVIYVYKTEGDEEPMVAYDAEKGVVHYHLDSNGDRTVGYYTEAEMALRLKSAEEIAKKCVDNEELFLQCIEDYSDNSDFHTKYAPTGMYFSVGTYATDSIFATFSNELAKLEEGDLAVLNSDSGYYILMRVELDAGAWQKEENSRWFDTLTGLTIEHMLQKRTAEYIDRVSFDEELLKTVDIRMVAANNYY
ncbi:MAG: hypothetical protein E7644_02390 [Ruminococcaceae bacterium]|nr:hypothetical protein [Oscillospiraceae bacterium]